MTFSKLIAEIAQLWMTIPIPSICSWIFEKFVLLMVAYFLLSIVNSLAQGHDSMLLYVI